MDAIPYHLDLVVEGRTYTADRVPNAKPFTNAPQIVSYAVTSPNGPGVVSVNVRSIALHGQTIDTHLAEWISHQARIAAKRQNEGSNR